MAGGENAVRSTWTDERLDDFKTSVESRFDELSGRVDKLNQTMVHGFIAMFVSMLTGFLTLAGMIATQL